MHERGSHGTRQRYQQNILRCVPVWLCSTYAKSARARADEHIAAGGICYGPKLDIVHVPCSQLVSVHVHVHVARNGNVVPRVEGSGTEFLQVQVCRVNDMYVYVYMWFSCPNRGVIVLLQSAPPGR